MLAAVILGALLRLSIAVPPRCRFDDGPLVPPYYVAYKVEPGAIAVDGDLEDPAWAEDSHCYAPRLRLKCLHLEGGLD